VVFQLELKDRSYVLRSPDMADAERWVYRLKTIRDEARSNSIPEEPSSPPSSPKTKDSKPKQAAVRAADSPEVEKGSGDFKKSDSKSCCIIM
jgi:hypothetical protein